MTELLCDVDHGTVVRSGADTFDAYLTHRWLPHMRSLVRAETWERHESLVRVQIVPRVGKVKLAALRPHHLQRMLDDMLAAGAPGVRREVPPGHGERDLPGRPVAAARGLARRRRLTAARRAREPADPRRVRDACACRRRRLHAHALPVLLAATTGARRGELLALTWREVDLETGTVAVRQGKTASARRTIHLPATMVSALRAHRKEQNERRLLCGHEAGQGRTLRNTSARTVKAEIAGSKPVGRQACLGEASSLLPGLWQLSSLPLPSWNVHDPGVLNAMDDDRIRALYGEPPEGFIAARDALVRELKDAGHTEDAAMVKALRKPTVSAWAVNQLAEREASGVEELLDAGAEVRSAQQAAMSSGASADRLREATAARRQVVGRLADSAGRALRGSGRAPDAHLEEIRSTLEAASVDAELGERLRAGTIERATREAGGFGDVFGLQLVPEDKGGTGAGTGKTPGSKVAPSKVETGKLRRDAAAAERKARQARDRADRLADQVQTSKARLEELTEKHAVAETAALQAELGSKRAQEALRQAGGRHGSG